MNTVTIAAVVILAVVIGFAIWGSIKTFRSESCCDDDRNCCSCKTNRCSIRKDQD